MNAFFIALAVVLAAIALTLVFVILRGVRHRAGVAFPVRNPTVDLAGIWRDWPAAADADDDERARRAILLEAVLPEHRQAVRDDLLRFEARALAEREPLPVLRRELMDSIDRRMLNREILALPEHLRQRLRAQSGDVIANDAAAEAYLAANELRLEILREYAGRRYGDRAPYDWFEVYEHAARLKQRTARDYIARSLNGELTDEARQQAIGLVDSQLRAHLLKVAPGTRFEQLAGKRPAVASAGQRP